MVLGTHFTRASDVIVPDYLTTSPSVPISPYRDVFGHWCSRIAPAGRMRLSADGVVSDTGLPDAVVPSSCGLLARFGFDDDPLTSLSSMNRWAGHFGPAADTDMDGLADPWAVRPEGMTPCAGQRHCGRP
jgi:hypothetical protein